MNFIAQLGDDYVNIPIPEHWTGKVSISIFLGKMAKKSHRLREDRLICKRCGSDEHLALVEVEAGVGS